MPSGDKVKGIISAVAVLALTFLYVVIWGDRVSSESESAIAERRERANAARLERLAGNYRVQFEFPNMPDLEWTCSREVAIHLSRQTGKRIFLALDSQNSVYAAKNRINFFGKHSEVRKAMAEYVLLSLFIDSIPKIAINGTTSPEWENHAIEANHKIQRETLEDVAVPYYAIVEPANDGGLKLIARSPKYRLANEDTQVFLDFLQNHIQ